MKELKFTDYLKKIKLKWILLIVPGILGYIGFRIDGNNMANSFYAAIGLYERSVDYDYNNILVEIARWTALISVSAVILSIFEGIHIWIKNYLISLDNKSIAVYADETVAKTIVESSKNSEYKKVLWDKNRVRFDTSKAIISFDNDMKNIEFLKKNAKMLSKKDIYIRLDNLDPFLLDREDAFGDGVEFKNIHYFNGYEIAARKYWHDNYIDKVANGDKSTFVIVIIGFTPLGEQLLRYGIELNLYRLNQSIEYHIFEADDFAKKKYLNVASNMMNDDRIIFHEGNWWNDNVCDRADRVIIAGEDVIMPVEWFMQHNCADKQIHYYSPQGIELNKIYKVSYINKADKERKNIFELKGFGGDNEVLSIDNIIIDDTILNAKIIHATYMNKFDIGNVGEISINMNVINEEWKKLDGFLRQSNIMSVESHLFRRRLCKDKKYVGIEESNRTIISKLEHIRWCRYYLMNGWRAGVPADGTRKDPREKIHSYIVDYDMLEERIKKLDWDTVITCEKVCTTISAL